MSFLIGDFSSEQYKAYLNSAAKQEHKGKKSHWVAHFHLSHHSTLAVLVNRIAYFLLHRFAVYPNNAYLFQKFKSYDFTQIDTEEQYEIIKEIFACFQNCSELDEAELGNVEEKLNEIENRLLKETNDAKEAKKQQESEEAEAEALKRKEIEAEALKKKEKETEAEALKKKEVKEAEILKQAELEEAETLKKEAEALEKQKVEEVEAAKRKDSNKPQNRRKILQAKREAQKKKDAKEAVPKELECEEVKKKKEVEKTKEIENANKEDESKKLDEDVEPYSPDGDAFDPRDDEKPEDPNGKKEQGKDKDKDLEKKSPLIIPELKVQAKGKDQNDQTLKADEGRKDSDLYDSPDSDEEGLSFMPKNSEREPFEPIIDDDTSQRLKDILELSQFQIVYKDEADLPKTFIKNVKKLEREVLDLALVKKAEQYEKARKDHANNKSYIGWISDVLRRTNQFDSKAYQDFDLDSQSLDKAISKAQELVAYLNIKQSLTDSGQLSQEDKEIVNLAIVQIRIKFKKMTNLLGEVYSVGDPSDKKWNSLFEKSKLLQEIEEDDIIAKTSGTAQKTFINHVWDYTFGYVLNETVKVKYLKWKIERYEDLIKAVQQGINTYLDETNLGNAKDLIQQAKQVNAAEWMKKLLPVLEFSLEILEEGDERLHPNYLNKVRNIYTNDMLTKLREAAKWAKEHPTMPGIEHVNAICYQLYATVNLNHRCQEILNTFLKLDTAVLKKANKHSLPLDPRYAMLNGLQEAHEQIKAVPNEAKAPALKQWANSLRGHLNGIWGLTTFDPNLQSNPMHVFFNKIIKKKGDDSTGRQVKDIAMGSPTIENGNGEAEINPEFEGFLRRCQALKLKHLYINNQDFTSTRWIKGNEAKRCQTLHDLAENDFKETLYVITLNQNTAFYEQRYELNKTILTMNGLKEKPEMNAQKVKDALILDLLKGKSKNYLPAHLIIDPNLLQWIAKTIDNIHQQRFNKCDEFENETVREQFIQIFHHKLRKHVEKLIEACPTTDGKEFGYSIYYSGAKEFKDELIAQLFDRTPTETGNYLPDDLVTRFDLRNWSMNAIDQIHEKLFGGVKDLTIEERRIFIRIVYQNLARKVLIETEAHSYNASCKDRIDRGAATDAEDFAYLAVLEDCMNDPRVVEFFEMLVFARAIIVRKRTIREERLERLIETIKFMIDHQKQLQDLNHALFPDVELTIDQFKQVEPEPEKKERVKKEEVKLDWSAFSEIEEEVEVDLY